jgi:hypothetical protein
MFFFINWEGRSAIREDCEPVVDSRDLSPTQLDIVLPLLNISRRKHPQLSCIDILAKTSRTPLIPKLLSLLAGSADKDL